MFGNIHSFLHHARKFSPYRGQFSLAVLIFVSLLFFSESITASEPNSINQKTLEGNNKNEKTSKSFSATSPQSEKSGKKTASQEPKVLDIYVPATIPVLIHQRNFAIPFSIQTGAEDPPVAIELLYTFDAGKEWRSFGRVQAASPQRNFFFRAEKDGEYWFALRTFFKSGKESASEAQKIKIQTAAENPQTAKASIPHSGSKKLPSKIDLVKSDTQKNSSKAPRKAPSTEKVKTFVKAAPKNSPDDPPLLMLPEDLPTSAKTKKEPVHSDDSELRKQKLLNMANHSVQGPSSKTADGKNYPASGTFKNVSLESAVPAPASLPSNESKGSGPQKENKSPNKNPASKEQVSEDIVFPGKIKSISMGQTQSGEPTILIRWFRPEDAGEKNKKGGSITIERSESANGPWIPIVSNLDLDQKGYWWRATQMDTIPFHVRTVSVDSYGKEWKDVLPQKLDLSSNLQGRISGNGKPETNHYQGSVPAIENKAPNLPEKKGASQASLSAWQDPPKPPEQSSFMETGLQKELKNTVNSGSGTSVPNSPSENSGNFAPENNPLAGQGQNSGPYPGSGTGQNPGTGYSDLQSYTPSPSPNGNGNGYGNGAQNNSAPQRRYEPATDPGRFSLNPIFTRGFGAIFHREESMNEEPPTRVPPVNGNANPYSNVSMSSDQAPVYSAPNGMPQNGMQMTGMPQNGIQSVPQTGAIRQETPSRRSIFQAPARENPPASPQQPQNGYNNGEMSWNGGPAPGAGDVIYLDQNGNRIQNPFPQGSMGSNQVFPVDAQGQIMFHSPMPNQGTGAAGQYIQNGQPQYQLPEQGMMQGYAVPSASGSSRSGQNLPFQENPGNRVPLSSGEFMVQ
ncbi:MAG: hypothetical protein Q4G69_06065 [Planctomycetia bacterium]|nr:hypothetical protein [Planctomycetia bacterium]